MILDEEIEYDYLESYLFVSQAANGPPQQQPVGVPPAVGVPPTVGVPAVGVPPAQQPNGVSPEVVDAFVHQ